MKIVIDMNLSPAWVSMLDQAGHDATHWSSLGRPDARGSAPRGKGETRRTGADAPPCEEGGERNYETRERRENGGGVGGAGETLKR